VKLAIKSADVFPYAVRPYEPPRFSIFQDFLTLEELNGLIDYALSHQVSFRTSQVIQPTGSHSTVDYHKRRSSVLREVGPWHALIGNRLRSCFLRILKSLNYPAFSIGNIEAQITATNDGGYFRLHNDNTHHTLAMRELTYVLFFYREPKAFTGGELRLYESHLENDRYRPGPRWAGIAPQQNAVIFFPSCFMHEVTSVSCPSAAFADGRFTINGWIRRKPESTKEAPPLHADN